MLCVQRTGWGKSRGVLRRHRAAARRGRRAGADRVAAARADAQPDRRGRAARHPRAHDQLDQPRRVGRGARAARRRRGRPAADQPRAAQQPAVPRRDAAAVRRARRAARGRRGALHLATGGTTSGPTTGASAEMLERLPDGVAVLGTTATANDRVVADVVEQLGRRRRAVRTYRGPLGPLEPAPGGRRAARRRPTGSRGWRPAAEAAGLGHRLHAHQARRRARRRVADARTGSRPRPTAARSRPSGASRSRSACSQRRQGRRRHERARHGLRQARPRLRRALPGARLGRSPTTSRSGRAGPRRRARRRRAAARRRGPPHPGLLHRAGVPAARARRARARGARRGGGDGCRCRS